MEKNTVGQDDLTDDFGEILDDCFLNVQFTSEELYLFLVSHCEPMRHRRGYLNM